jgi:uncharacterized membrane protein
VYKYREILKNFGINGPKTFMKYFDYGPANLLPSIFYLIDQSSITVFGSFFIDIMSYNIGLQFVDMDIFVCLTITLIYIVFNP